MVSLSLCQIYPDLVVCKYINIHFDMYIFTIQLQSISSCRRRFCI